MNKMNEYLYDVYDKKGNYLDTGYIQEFGNITFVKKVDINSQLSTVKSEGYLSEDIILQKVEHKYKIEIIGE